MSEAVEYRLGNVSSSGHDVGHTFAAAELAPIATLEGRRLLGRVLDMARLDRGDLRLRQPELEVFFEEQVFPAITEAELNRLQAVRSV